MYRLMLYYLILLWLVALVFCLLGIISINPISLTLSTSFIVLICWIINKTLSLIFKAPTNFESVYISALILALIISPANSTNELPLLFCAAVLAMAGKYIVAINHQHIFNPVAFGIALSALILNQQASWWVAVLPISPFILVGGLLVVRKIQRADLVFSFFLITLIISFLKIQTLLDVQLMFFALVMLTEPQTTPPTKNLRILYGALVGILANPQIHFGTYYFTPELALMTGNLFSYLISPRPKLLLKLDKKLNLAPNTFDFIFQSDKKLIFSPGQYLEWTLSHPNPDSRGNRRYFTIAASPTEEQVRIGVKFYDQGSSFKKALSGLEKGNTIVASQLSGEFTLPKDPNIPLVFMAGGIGITPFRSMIKYLMDKEDSRDMVLIYAVKTEEDIAYKQILEQAQKKIGIQVVYQTDKQGRVDERLIKQTVPDLKNSLFYLSGPHGMVTSFEQLLKNMGIPKNQIKVDFFPGYV